MKEIKLMLLLLVLGTQLFAQSRTDAVGGEATGSGGTASYSVGLIDYQVHVGSTGSHTDGVQQPYELFVVRVDDGLENAGITVYPNPTSEFVVLDVGNLAFDEMRYVLCDLNGKFLAGAAMKAKQIFHCVHWPLLHIS
jgi:hypothetical protein